MWIVVAICTTTASTACHLLILEECWIEVTWIAIEPTLGMG